MTSQIKHASSLDFFQSAAIFKSQRHIFHVLSSLKKLTNQALEKVRLSSKKCVFSGKFTTVHYFGETMPNLTEELIQSLQPSNKPVDVRDTNLTGFMVRVNINGTKTYYVEYTRGRRVKIGKYGQHGLNLKFARLKAQEIIVAAKNGQLNKSQEATVDITYEEYLTNIYYPYLKNNNKNPDKAIRILTSSFKKLLPYKLNKIPPIEIERWKAENFDKGNVGSTINRNLAELKSCLNRAVDLKLLKENPIKETKRVKVNSKPKTRYFTQEERTAALACLSMYPVRFQTMIIVSMHTGLRKNELCQLEKRHVHFDKLVGAEKISYIEVKAEDSKNHDQEMVPLNITARQALLDWFAHPEFLDDSKWVFANPSTKKPYQNIRWYWEKLKKQIGIQDENNFRWHDLRHDCASQMAMKGVPIQAIKEVLRHKKIEMTLRYAHLSPKTLVDAVRQLD